MASHIITTRNIRWRLTPLSSSKGYVRIRPGTQLRGGAEKTEIYRWDCATRTGTQRMLSKIGPLTRSDFRDVTENDPATARLKFKAKKLDVLTATDLSPTGWETAVNSNFTFPEATINWQAFIGDYKADQSFVVYLVVKHVYFLARPELTAAQKKAPNIAPIDGMYILIGLPVEWEIRVEYGAPCNGAEKRADSGTPRKIPPAEPLAPLFKEHEKNEEDLKPFELPGNGLDLPNWDGFNHEDLEPDPSEFEDPVEEDPVDEPLNPFEEWMFELWDFIDEAEAFGSGNGGGSGGAGN